MKDRILYLECASGISGDMTVAALLDLGADQKKMEQALGSLPVDGFKIAVSRVKKSGLDACDFSVVLDEAHENHDHDMEYLHGHDHEMHTDHHHEHRGMPEIENIINAAQMSESARELSLKIFRILAAAEAKAHGVPAEQVHFHEVGAVDSIADIVAAAVCLDDLGIREAVIPELCEGRGTVRCQHGILPVPVPAVTNIVQDHGLKLHITETQGELVTPTGAAIAAAICTTDRLPERFSIIKTGLGAGKRNYECPSLLRAMILVPEETDTGDKYEYKDRIYRLETNIDDCSGETMGYVMDCLMEAGARDVSYTPVFMKKNRPAYQMNVICKPEDAEKLENIIFRETTTIGIRRTVMERTVLPRKIKTVHTKGGDAEIKECTLPDGTVRRYPEYASAAGLAADNGISYQEAFQMIQQAGKTCQDSTVKEL